jgi:putative membrane protein
MGAAFSILPPSTQRRASVGRFLVQVVINAIALYVAAVIVPGAEITGEIGYVLLLGLILGVLNALVRPILSFFTCPFYVLTLGLFTFIMNVMILWLVRWIADNTVGTGLITFDGFWSMLWVGVVVSIVSFVFNMFFGKRD